jgi:hypothetical protein
MLSKAMRIIIKAKLGKIDINNALDSIWELIINIDYELKAHKRGKITCDSRLISLLN